MKTPVIALVLLCAIFALGPESQYGIGQTGHRW